MRRRYFPGFRRADVPVLAIILAILALFALRNPDQTWREGALPALLIVFFAVWTWRRR